MNFNIDDEQMIKFAKWMSKHEKVYTGAIGGSYTFMFTPTSLGDILEVKNNSTMEVINLTDYTSW